MAVELIYGKILTRMLPITTRWTLRDPTSSSNPSRDEEYSAFADRCILEPIGTRTRF
jgi:hypothetical protein